MKSKIRKLNKFISLLEHPEGMAQAIFNHRTHVLYINENWSLQNIDYGNLPVNEFREVESEKFYNVLEKLEK